MRRPITSSTCSRLKRAGSTLLYVSHRLPEVFRLCDRITVLRDGPFAGTFDRADRHARRIVQAMVGRDLRHARSNDRAAGRLGTPALESEPDARPLPRTSRCRSAPGEIVGIFGLVGSGRSELSKRSSAFTGRSRRDRCVDGPPVTFRSPRDAGRAGSRSSPKSGSGRGCSSI